MEKFLNDIEEIPQDGEQSTSCKIMSLTVVNNLAILALSAQGMVMLHSLASIEGEEQVRDAHFVEDQAQSIWIRVRDTFSRFFGVL
jgi:hypothetical protein